MLYGDAEKNLHPYFYYINKEEELERDITRAKSSHMGSEGFE